MIEKKQLRVLCLGNNTEDTDIKTRDISTQYNSPCHGLLSEIDSPLTPDQYQLPGFYHSSIYDVEFGKLIDLGNQFDLVIMLDQPKTQWSHPDAFYNTVRVMQGLRVPIKFLNQDTASSIDYFKKLVETNPSFCAFPFIELLVDRGNTTICCRSSKPIVPIAELKNYQTDPNYQSIRKKMIQGQRVPEYCQSCYSLEKLGIRSARMQETVEWATRLDFNHIDDFQAVEKPFYYEVRASNKCNLQCRMCSPESSHLIDREYRRIGLADRHRTSAKKFGGGFEIVDFENLKKLYLTGGEPLVMHETYDFLEKCIKEGRTDFEFLINTNGTKLSEKFKQSIKEFQNLQFIFSIDGFGPLNHYIRWPSDWKTIVGNWHYLRDNNHKITVNTTVSIYNIHRLHELYQFIDDEFPGTLVHCQIVESPQYLSPWIFPEKYKVLDSLNKVQQTFCYKNDPLFASSIDGYVDFFESGKKYQDSSLKDFFQFNDLLDKSRSIRLVDYDPFLDNYRQYC